MFNCSNINTDSPLSSKRVKLEKLLLRNLRFPQQNIPEDRYAESRHQYLQVTSSGLGQVTGTWECGNVPSGSIICREFLD
jgi:hypothetical protein